MELNAEQIKKALDWLDSLVGNSDDSDIALFTYQLLGILYDTCEELTEKNAIQAVTAIELDKQVERLTAEVDNLGKALEKMSADHERAIRLTEVYTVRKMQEKLKKYYDRNDMYLGYSIAYNVDRVANEMVEEYSNEKG